MRRKEIRYHGFSSVPGILAAVLTVVSLLGCSVKEDRDSCPCNLLLDLTDALSNADGGLLLSVCGEDGFFYSEVVEAGTDVRDVIHAVQVPRELLRVDVFHPVDAVSDPRAGYRPDRSCARIWKFSDVIAASGEAVEREVMLRKEYCSLSIVLAGNGGVAPPFSIVLRSQVDGYLPGGGLSEGIFVEEVSPELDAAANAFLCTVNLLRQKDASLMMDIVPRDGREAPLRSFALGEYLQASGYDWNAPDLEDVEMSLDFASTSIRISTEKWTRTMEFNVVI